MLDVNHIVADGEVAEVRDESGCFRFGSRLRGASGDVGFVGDIVRAEDEEIVIGKIDAVGYRAAKNDGRAIVTREIA